MTAAWRGYGYLKKQHKDMYSLQITWPSTALKLELKSGMGVAIYNGLELGLHRKIRLIESNAKC
jgi:hypothetical protein